MDLGLCLVPLEPGAIRLGPGPVLMKRPPVAKDKQRQEAINWLLKAIPGSYVVEVTLKRLYVFEPARTDGR